MGRMNVMVETKFDTDSEDEKRDVEDEKLDMWFFHRTRVKHMANRWLDFLKSFRSKHKDMSLKQAMKAASQEYKKQKPATKQKKKRKK